MNNNIYTVCCDTLEFDVDLRNEDGTAFVLDDDDKLWFAVKQNYSDATPLIYAEQHSTHFKITQISPEVPSGIYNYEIGILFGNQTEKTVVTQSKLYVEPKIKGHSYE